MSPASPSRWRPPVRRVLLLAAAVSAVVFLFLLASGFLVRTTASPEEIARRLSERMKTPIAYDALEISWSGVIRARGLRMARAGESEVVSGALLEVGLSRWKLFRGGAEPAWVRFTGGTWNASRAGGGAMGSFFARNRTEGPLPFDFEILGARVLTGGKSVEGVRIRQEEGATAFLVEADRIDGAPLGLSLQWDGDTTAGRGRLRVGPCDWPILSGFSEDGARGEGIRIDAAVERSADSISLEGTLEGERLRIGTIALVRFSCEGRYEREGTRERIQVTKGIDRAMSPMKFTMDLRRRGRQVVSLFFDWDGPTERLPQGGLDPAAARDLRGRSAGRIRWTDAGYEGEFRPRGVSGRAHGPWRFEEVSGTTRFKGSRWGRSPEHVEFDLLGRVSRGDSGPAGPQVAIVASVSEDRFDSGRMTASAAPLGEVLSFLPMKGLSGSGSVDLDLSLSGAISAPRVTGSARLSGAEIGFDSPAVRLSGVAGTVRWNASGREIDLSSRAPRLTAKGTLPAGDSGSLRLSLVGEAVPVSLLTRFLPAGLEGSGEISRIDLDLRGTMRSPEVRGTLRLSGTNLRLPGTSRAAENLRGVIAFEDGWIRTEDLRLEIGGDAVQVRGGYRISDGAFSHLSLTAPRIDLGRLLDVLPPARRPFPPGSGISGPISDLDLTLDGPAERVRTAGEATAGGLTIRLPRLAAPIEEIRGRLRFDGDAARTDSITARFGGHLLYLTGEAPLAPGGAMRARYAVRRADLAALLPLLPGEAAGLLAPPASLTGFADLVGRIEVAGERVIAEGEIGQGEIRLFGLDHREAGGTYRYESSERPARRRLELTSMHSAVATGRIGGDLLLESRNSDPLTYRIGLTLDRLPLERALALAASTQRVRGEATGRIRIDGRWGEGDDARGEGTLRLDRVVLEDLASARSLVRAVRIDPTAARAAMKGGLTFTIGRGEIRTRDLVLASPDIAIGAAGAVRLDGASQLDLTVDLAGGPLGFFLNATRISSLFGARGEGAVLRVRGKMTGPIADPHVDLDLGAWERLTGGMPPR